MGCPPRASIECTDRMLVFMGPVSLVVGHRQEHGLRPLVHWLARGEKLGMDPLVGQLACCGLCQESFFSGAVGSIQIYRRLTKGCYMWTT
jgi:hypothetical protein